MNYFDTAADMNLTWGPIVCHLYEMVSYSIKTLQKKIVSKGIVWANGN